MSTSPVSSIPREWIGPRLPLIQSSQPSSKLSASKPGTSLWLATDNVFAASISAASRSISCCKGDFCVGSGGTGANVRGTAEFGLCVRPADSLSTRRPARRLKA